VGTSTALGRRTLELAVHERPTACWLWCHQSRLVGQWLDWPVYFTSHMMHGPDWPLCFPSRLVHGGRTLPLAQLRRSLHQAGHPSDG